MLKIIFNSYFNFFKYFKFTLSLGAGRLCFFIFYILLPLWGLGGFISAQNKIEPKKDTTKPKKIINLLSEEVLNKMPIFMDFVKAQKNYSEVYRFILKNTGGAYGKVKEIPYRMDTLENLQSFQCINEDITEIPTRFTKLIQLQRLYLGNNLFKDIPKEVFLLENLKILDMQFNQITHISEDISKLQKLEMLFLNNNPNLEKLPLEALKKLPNLKRIVLKNTPISVEMRKIIRRNLTKVHIEF